jgi:N-methylhydantoinase A
MATAAGYPDVITGDIGGTSFDVSLIAGGRAALAAQTSIAFGMVVRSPMIQIETIGAGGGSIASVDVGGMLQVGPESAGSVPGPACYGRGNQRPTVTDANVLLGRIAAERPLGGGLLGALDVQKAREAIRRFVAEPLGMDVLQAAEAILTVANAKMAGAMRLVSIEKGHDPRQFAYMPFGGGGGLHVCDMMREVGVATGIVPRYPGVTSALGCVMADMRHDAVQTLNQPLAALDFAQLRALRSDWPAAAASGWIPPGCVSRACAKRSRWTCSTRARPTPWPCRCRRRRWTPLRRRPRSRPPTAPSSAACSTASRSGS